MREGERSLESMRELLRQFNSNANTIDLITVFRDRLIADFAAKHNYDFVLKGLNADSLAAESFCYFAKGLGGNLPGLCVSEHLKSPFYYPLRGHSRKELQYYFYTRKISTLALKSDPDNIEEAAGSKLDDQISGFIDTLQQMYSHTAAAIVRTAEKIETNLPSHEPCQWCLLPGAEESGLCRRCLRVWEGRKKTGTLVSFPLQLPQ
jgi:tRNA(Ile)-lysidine synthase TilS/MesJ